MKQYEYHRTANDILPSAEFLNELGKRGWRLMVIARASSKVFPDGCILYFEREIDLGIQPAVNRPLDSP